MFVVDRIKAEIEARGWAPCRVSTPGHRAVFVEWPGGDTHAPVTVSFFVRGDDFDVVKVVDDAYKMARQCNFDPATGQPVAQLALDLE